MKPIEEAFASETFRRVILPGIVLAAGVHPLMATVLPRIDFLYGVGSPVLLIGEVVFFGLVVSSTTQLIYYVYEGFRLEPLTALAGRANKRRVQRLSELMDRLQSAASLSAADETRRSKTYEALLDFPVRRREDGTAEHYAERPTRLGNIIAVYELYPETRYGFNGIFYWFHLLSLTPDSSRREFSGQYAFAESLVLASFSGALVAILHAIVLIGFGMGMLYHRLVFVVLQTGPKTSISLMVFGVTIWGLFYAAALPAHREAGKQFQSIVDVVMPSFAEWLTKVKAPLDDAVTLQLEHLERYLTELSSK